MVNTPLEEKKEGGEPGFRRQVRSFVLRAGRLTEGQRRALEELWPVFGVDERAGKIDFESLFGNTRPVIMEIGFGDGEATWRMAASHPQENYIGVEVHRPGIGRLLMQLERHGIENVRIACADAVELLRERIPENSLAGVRIFFPDPWPKKRHHKRRIIQPAFIKLLAAQMEPGAILHVATDWEPYAQHMLEVMLHSSEFANLSPSGAACPKPEWRPETKYEKRGKRLGHKVSDLVFQRRPD